MVNFATNQNLRSLLRTARSLARLSQKEAARKAGVSPAWWKRVESAAETTVAPETLVSMLDAVGVLPRHLDDLNEHELAELLQSRISFRSAKGPAAPEVLDSRALEAYLLKAPAPEDVRQGLVAYARAQRTLRLRTEPFQDQFLPPSA